MPHDGDHEAITDDHEGPPSEYEVMSRAMQEILIDKGFVSAEAITEKIEISYSL